MVTRRELLATGALAASAIACPHDDESSQAPDWAALARSIEGTVTLPGDEAYDDGRALVLRQFDDVRPAAIVSCAEPSDVAKSIRFARRYGLPAVPRGGRHSYAGFSTATGMVIDVSGLRHIEISPGLIRVQGGTQLVDLTYAAVERGLSVPAGWCPTVGIGGLVLGGGMGLQTRRYGLTADRMRAAEVVLADGSTVHCDAIHHPDLFWALRGGGGGNFGVVTSVDFEPVPADPMTTFTLTWPWEAAVDTCYAWERWAPGLPDEMTAVLDIGLADSAPSAVPAVTVTGIWLGPDPAPVAGHLDRMIEMVGTDPASREIAATVGFLDGMRSWYGCSDLTQEQCGQRPSVTYARARGNFVDRPISHEGWRRLLAAYDADRRPGQMRNLDLQALGGAAARVRPQDTAYVHRSARYYLGYSVDVESGSRDEEEAAQSWVDDCWAALQPLVSGGTYVNYPDPALSTWRQAYYGANIDRLEKVKRHYDPDRFFDFPQAV